MPKAPREGLASINLADGILDRLGVPTYERLPLCSINSLTRSSWK
jgi:hypothetical protein